MSSEPDYIENILSDTISRLEDCAMFGSDEPSRRFYILAVFIDDASQGPPAIPGLPANLRQGGKVTDGSASLTEHDAPVILAGLLAEAERVQAIIDAGVQDG